MADAESKNEDTMMSAIARSSSRRAAGATNVHAEPKQAPLPGIDLATKDMPAQNLSYPIAVNLRNGMPADAEDLGVICYEAFKRIAEQHRFPPDFPSPAVAADLMRMMLSRNDIHAVVAERDGRLIGSNFLWEGGTVAGIGPITIDPEVQNGSIGRSLMEAVLGRARWQGIASVRLVQAAYHARSLSLYTKLGFVVREPLAVLQGPALSLPVDGFEVRPGTEADIDAASELCRRVHGHDRAPELRDAVRQGTATVVEQEGRLTGYATGIGFFGHAVGETADDLKALIGAAGGYDGPGFLIPMRNTEVFRWCLEKGLRVVQPMTLMTLGPYKEPDGAFLPSILF
jgi:predicted N-acetyltransferase YhbS